VLTLPDSANRRLLHVSGGREIRLADAKRDDVLALAHEFSDLGQDDEGILGSEFCGAAAYFWHGIDDRAEDAQF